MFVLDWERITDVSLIMEDLDLRSLFLILIDNKRGSEGLLENEKSCHFIKEIGVFEVILALCVVPHSVHD